MNVLSNRLRSSLGVVASLALIVSIAWLDWRSLTVQFLYAQILPVLLIAYLVPVSAAFLIAIAVAIGMTMWEAAGAFGIAHPFTLANAVLPVFVFASTILVFDRLRHDVRERAALDAQLQVARASQLIAQSSPTIVFTATATGEIDFVNERWIDVTGVDTATALQYGWHNAVYPGDLEALQRSWAAAIAGGHEFVAEHRLRTASGEYRWHIGQAVPVRDPSGTITSWVGTTTDIDEVKRTQDQLAFLAALSNLIEDSFDAEEPLRRIARAALPFLADWCQIDLWEPDGRLITKMIVHDDLAKERLAQQFIGQAPVDVGFENGSSFVARTGETRLFATITPDLVESARLDSAGPALYRVLDFRSALVVPLVAYGQRLGALSLFYAESERVYAKSDISIAQETARRLATAFANATAFASERLSARRSRFITERLQELFTPSELPSFPNVRFDGFYAPAEADALVGGDWYDVIVLRPDLLMFSIGDVVGHGLAAAIDMGRIRQSIVTAASNAPTDPSEVLRQVNRVARLQRIIATAFVGTLDLQTSTLTVASAGHPPAFLLTGLGDIVTLAPDGITLGVLDEAVCTPLVIAFTPESTIVAYTDGLTELRRNVVEGERHLREYLRTIQPGEAIVARELHAAIVGDDAPQDDIAILVIGMVSDNVSAVPQLV